MSTTATAVSSAGKPVRRFPPPCWTQDEALALIQVYRERWYALRRGYLRTADWDAVAEEVGRLCPGATPPKTSAQCRHKIEKLRQRYRAEKQRAMSFSGGQFLSTWFYFDAMDSMEKNGTGSNHDEERNTGNDVNLKINDQLNTSIDPVYGGLNPGRGFRFKPVAAGPAGSQLVTVASRANNVRVSHNYVAQEEDNDDEIENAYYETLAGKNSGKRNTLASQNYASRFQPDYQNIESIGIRPRKFGKIGANVSHSHGYWNGTGGDDDDDDDDNDVGEDDVWVKMPKDRSSVSMDYNERISRGSGHHYFDGESEFSRGVKRESDDSIGQIVASIKLLADGFVKMERMKMDMVHEIEKQRLEAEMKRNKMLLESQKQIVEAFVKGLRESKQQQQ